MNGTRELVVGAGALTLAMVVAVGALGKPGHVPSPARPIGPATTQHGQMPGSDGLPDLDSLPPTAAGPVGAHAVPQTSASSLARQQIEALVDSSRPADALLAYRLLAICAATRAQESTRSDVAGFQGHAAPGAPGACDGLDQSLVERRVALLQAAVGANVKGAAAELLAQGPEGQPIASIWNDPRYAGWKRQAVDIVTQAAEHGDAPALAALTRLYGSGALPGEDGAAAIKYWVAWTDVTAAADAARSHDAAQSLANVQRAVSRYGAFLTPAQAAAAVAAGHALSAGCCGA